MEFTGNTLSLIAADGFRLAVHQATLLEPVEESTEVIVPAKSLQELNRLLGDQDEPVLVLVNPNRSQLLFKLKNLEMVSQLIQGTFPNYREILPKSHDTKAVVDVQELLRASRLAAIFAQDASGIVRLFVTPGEGPAPGKATICAKAEEIGENQSEIDTVVEGNASKIAFNSRYLLDVLSVLGRGKVVLETTSPSSPGVFKPVDAENYIHVVMPMFVQW